MADLAKVRFQGGDTLWKLLDNAGFKQNEIPGQLKRIAEANGTTVEALDHISPDKPMLVPRDIADKLPANRLESFQGGPASPTDTTQRPPPAGMATRMQTPEVIGNLANKTLNKMFDGYEVKKENVDGGFRFTATPRDFGDMSIIVDLKLPVHHQGWTDAGTITMTNDASGYSATVDLNAADVAGSIKNARARLELTHEVARNFEVTLEMPERKSALDARFQASVASRDIVEDFNGKPLDTTRAELSVTDSKTGKKHTLLTNDASIEETRKWAAEEGIENEGGWSISAGAQLNGGVASFVSASWTEGGYQGGAHPNAYTRYATFDANTGNEVSLHDLLPKEQVEKLLDNAHKAAVLLGEDSGMFVSEPREKYFDEIASKSFQLSVDAQGGAKVSIGIPHAVEVARGMCLDVTTDLPASRALYEKLGLDKNVGADRALTQMMSEAKPVVEGTPYVSVDVDAWMKEWFGVEGGLGGSVAHLSGDEKKKLGDMLDSAAPGIVAGLRHAIFDFVEKLS